MRIDVFHHVDSITDVNRKLDQILALLKGASVLEGSMSKELDALQAQVQANNDVTNSAVALIQGLAAQIESLKTDPVALQALADSLKSQDDALAAAITTNTPAAA